MIKSKQTSPYLGATPSDEWYAEAARLQMELIDRMAGSSQWLDILVRPAYTGSWRVGFIWRGSFRITVSVNPFNECTPPTERAKGDKASRYFRSSKTRTYIDGDPVYSRHDVIDAAERWVKKQRDAMSPFWEASYLVSLYRKSGLIPKHIAKRHGSLLRERFGEKDRFGRISVDYSRKDVRQFLRFRAANYIRLYSACPDCGGKGFQETILGWECGRCPYGVHDYGNEFITPAKK